MNSKKESAASEAETFDMTKNEIQRGNEERIYQSQWSYLRVVYEIWEASMRYHFMS